MSRPARLALADGTVFAGSAFGSEGEVYGEVVFNTSMTGYQEIVTDPSYCGQIVTMTYPQIGNYGVNPQDVESGRLALRGFVVRELCEAPSNYRATKSLSQYLADAGVIGLAGIDTRALVRRLRVHGVMTGILSTTDLDDASLVAKARSSPQLVGLDLVKEVMPAGATPWSENLTDLGRGFQTGACAGGAGMKESSAGGGIPATPQAVVPHVVAIDYGMKWNIPRHLTNIGCRVTVAPGHWSAEQILDLKPDGVFLSNGPGDPEPLDYAINTIRGVLGKVPVFGICLGHQLLGLACGGETYKLKFGHRGANQPVLNKETGRVEITSQNHGFAIRAETLPPNVEVTHLNLNDQTVEGLKCKDVPAFSVQYHPEAAAGPHDSHYLFQQFRKMLPG